MLSTSGARMVAGQRSTDQTQLHTNPTVRQQLQAKKDSIFVVNGIGSLEFIPDKDFWEILRQLDEPAPMNANDQLDLFERKEESASPSMVLRSPIFRTEKDVDPALFKEVIQEPKNVAYPGTMKEQTLSGQSQRGGLPVTLVFDQQNTLTQTQLEHPQTSKKQEDPLLASMLSMTQTNRTQTQKKNVVV